MPRDETPQYEERGSNKPTTAHITTISSPYRTFLLPQSQVHNSGSAISVFAQLMEVYICMWLRPTGETPESSGARFAWFRDSRLHIHEKATTFRMLASTHGLEYASVLFAATRRAYSTSSAVGLDFLFF